MCLSVMNKRRLKRGFFQISAVVHIIVNELAIRIAEIDIEPEPVRRSATAYIAKNVMRDVISTNDTIGKPRK